MSAALKVQKHTSSQAHTVSLQSHEVAGCEAGVIRGKCGGYSSVHRVRGYGDRQ